MAIKSWLTAKAEANPYNTASNLQALAFLTTALGITSWMFLFVIATTHPLVNPQDGLAYWLVRIALVATMVAGQAVLLWLGMTLSDRVHDWCYEVNKRARHRRTVRFVKTNSPRRVEQRDFGNRFQCPKCGEIPITGPCPWGCDD